MADQTTSKVLCRIRCEVTSDTAYDASGWWMLAAAAVVAHVGVQEDTCAIHVKNCVYLRSRKIPLCFVGSDVRLFLTPHMMHSIGGCWQQQQLQHMLAYRRIYVPYMWKTVCTCEAGLVNPLVLCRVRCEAISDTAYDASGWWMLEAAAVAAHVGIREDICAIHVENCVFLRSRLGTIPSITISTPG